MRSVTGESADRGLPASAAGWAADVALRDGGAAHLRPITPADADALQSFHVAQSRRSTYLRFFSEMPRLSVADLERFTTVDHRQRVAFVVEVGGAIIGVGRYEGLGGGVAEVAFNVADAHQGRGIGSVLLEHLAAAAREHEVMVFRAHLLEQNHRMLDVFEAAGYAVTSRSEDGLVALEVDLRTTSASLATARARETSAEGASMRALLAPRAIAVVGAGRDGSGIGAALLRHLVDGGFTGEVTVVHPGARRVGGLLAVATLADVPTTPDLVVVAVPADAVPHVVAQCAGLGVRALLLVSGGFAEVGDDGAAAQRELVATARAGGMRVLGPNSFGALNTDPAVRLNASLSPRSPEPGPIGLFSQSGALGVAVLDAARRRRLGVSTFVSAGNRADVSGNDALQYWASDPATSVVGMYLESLGNPRKFSRVARSLASVKPVVVVKSATSPWSVPAGQAVRASSAPQAAFAALLRQAGVIRVETLHQLFDVSALLAHQPLPAGPRLAVVGNSEALAVLAAQAALGAGLQVVPPRTLTAEAGSEEMTAAMHEALDDPGVDLVLACFVPPLAHVGTPIARVVAAAAGAGRKTVAACLLGAPGVVGGGDGSMPGTRALPAYPTPEDAVTALAAAVRYAAWRERSAAAPVAPSGVDGARARRLVARWLAAAPQSPCVLGAPERRALLACFGIDVADGGPGGDSAGEPGGATLVLSSTEDSLCGPVVSLGVAGEASELLGDVVHAVPPLTGEDARDLVRSLRSSPRFFGYGGTPPVDVASLEDLVARVSVMALELPEVASAVLEPVVVVPGGTRVLGARVELAPPATLAHLDLRTLPR